MSIFYFTTPDLKEYELSCTTSVKVTENAVVTKSPVESGKSIVDNFYLDNKVISFSGIITNVTVSGQPENRRREVGDWIDEIRALRARKEMLVVHYDSLKVVPNCVITSFNINKTKEEGFSGWKCDMTFQEVDISERARVTEIPEPKPEVKDETDSKRSGSSNNKIQVGDTLVTSFGSDIGVSISKYVKGFF